MRIRLHEDVEDFITIGGKKIPTNTARYSDTTSYDDISRDFTKRYNADVAEKERVRKEKERQEAEAKAQAEFDAKNGQRLEEYDEVTAQFNEDGNVSEYIENLFGIFVPAEGDSDTIGGELVRAICRLNYRWFNDGDLFNVGYGIETCGGAAGFIYCTIEELGRIGECIAYCLEEMSKAFDDDIYEQELEKLVSLVATALSQNKNLFETRATESMFNYELPNELLGELEDIEPDISGELLDDGLDNGYIDWQGYGDDDVYLYVDEFLDDFVYDFNMSNSCNITVTQGARDVFILEDVPSRLVGRLNDAIYRQWEQACKYARDEWESNRPDDEDEDF